MEFGQILTLYHHFEQHQQHAIPVQVYKQGIHVDIGMVTYFDKNFVEIEETLYNRDLFTFVSRPGY